METKTKFKIALGVFLLTCVLVLFYFLVQGHTIAMLQPAGVIAASQKRLALTALTLMMIVVIPVFCFAGFVIFKYRATKNTNDYQPSLQESPVIAAILWAISLTLIGTIGVMIWQSSHALDPYKKLDSSVKPLTIQVVALNWKWLFIYPEQNIATVNYIEFPTGTPVHFELTADAPMNTFWIPQLGGQMYAMAGMQNQINLMADKNGEYNGSATEINGKGYAGMRFKADAVTQTDFDLWIRKVQGSSNNLSLPSYKELAKDSVNNSVSLYSSVESNLFDTIMMSFMTPEKSDPGVASPTTAPSGMPSMDMK